MQRRIKGQPNPQDKPITDQIRQNIVSLAAAVLLEKCESRTRDQYEKTRKAMRVMVKDSYGNLAVPVYDEIVQAAPIRGGRFQDDPLQIPN